MCNHALRLCICAVCMSSVSISEVCNNCKLTMRNKHEENKYNCLSFLTFLLIVLLRVFTFCYVCACGVVLECADISYKHSYAILYR